jgi:hypothetical protein
MGRDLRFALLDLVWAHSLDALQTAYRKLQDKPLTAHERESAAIIFNELVHHHALADHHT